MKFTPLQPHEYVIKRLNELRPSERYVYFTGFLEEERLKNHGVNQIANTAYRLMEQGAIILTQKRLSLPLSYTGTVSWIQGTGKGFDYIAIGALPKHRSVDWM